MVISMLQVPVAKVYKSLTLIPIPLVLTLVKALQALMIWQYLWVIMYKVTLMVYKPVVSRLALVQVYILMVLLQVLSMVYNLPMLYLPLVQVYKLIIQLVVIMVYKLVVL